MTRSNLSSLQIFQLIRYASFVLIGIGFAKLHLQQTSIGQFETFLMLSGMLSFFWVSGIINTVLALYPAQNEKAKKEVLFSAFVALLLLSALAAILLLLFSQNILSFLSKKNEPQLVLLGVIYLLLNNPSFIIEYVLYLNKESKGILIYAVVTAALSICAALLPVMFNCGIEYSMLGILIVALLRLCFSIWVLNRFATLRISISTLISTLGTCFRLSLPLMLSFLASGSSEYIDGLIVKAKFDELSFALYRYGARELPVLLIISNTLSTAMIPAISENFENGIAELRQKSSQLMHWFFPLTIILMPLSPYLYKYVFNESFIYSALIFNIYLLLIIPRVLFPQPILTALRKPGWVLLSAVIEIAINVSCSLYLADRFSLPGIAIGTLIAYLFDKVFLIAINYFVLNISPTRYVNIRPYLVYVVLTFVSFCISFEILQKF